MSDKLVELLRWHQRCADEADIKEIGTTTNSYVYGPAADRIEEL